MPPTRKPGAFPKTLPRRGGNTNDSRYPRTPGRIMSAEGQIYVERHSPYTGSTFALHLRLGLLSNDAHGYQIYSGDKYLADKCKCSVRTIKRAKAQLIKDGYLEPLFAGVGRHTAEYRFVFKGQEIGGQPVTPKRIGGQPRQNRGPNAASSPIYRNKLKETDNDISYIVPSPDSVPMPKDFKKVFTGNT